MLMNSPRTIQGGSSPRRRPDGQRNHQAGQLYDRHAAERIDPAVEISPDDIVKRRAVTWDGMAAEIVQATRHGRIELRFRAPHHLLAVYEQGVRGDGETLVEGLPRSTLRDFERKFTFVPAGHEYHELHAPRSLARVVYFNFDPAKMPTHFETGVASTALTPQLFFEDATLWETALKLMRLIESANSDNRLYFVALGIVLAHELVHLAHGA